MYCVLQCHFDKACVTSGGGTYGAPGARAPQKITTCSLCPPKIFTLKYATSSEQ